MNYTSKYNRAELRVDHPTLNLQPGQYRTGRKLYDYSKNLHLINVPTNDANKSFTNEVPLRDQFTYTPPPQEISESSLYDPYSNPPKHSNTTEDTKLHPIQPRQQMQDFNLSGNYQYPLNTTASKSPLKKQVDNLYSIEIEQLKEQLRLKEEAARRLQTDESTQPKQTEAFESVEMYNRVNKEMFDKRRVNEAKKETFQSLQNQVAEKEAQKNLFKLERERELARRLEDLEKYREDLEKQRKQQAIRQKEYGDHLSVQTLLRNELIKQEEYTSKLEPELQSFEVPSSMLINKSRAHLSRNELERNLGFYEGEVKTTESPIRLTKKSPLHKTMLYNPITGSLKDTSPYIFGSVSPNIIPRDPNPFLGTRKNQGSVASDFSVLPAFKNPQYTKSNPKLMPSNPITGDLHSKQIYTSEFKDDMATFFGVDLDRSRGENNKSMAGYGNLVIGGSSPNVRSQLRQLPR